MTNLPEHRRPSQVLKRGYSEEEVDSIYELGRLFLENGDLRRAEVIMAGLIEVAPDFAPAWLAASVMHVQKGNIEEAISTAERALQVQPDSAEAMLLLSACLLTTGDFNTAGTYLGEIGEKIESGAIDNSYIKRFYNAQLVRYQGR